MIRNVRCVYKGVIGESLLAVYMKLYWRYKKKGKWTWAPAKTLQSTTGEVVLYGKLPKEEEE